MPPAAVRGFLARWLLTVAALAMLLTGCARNRAAPDAAQDRTRPLGTITVVPVTSPAALFTDNRSPPVVGWLWVSLANTMMDKEKSAEFDARYADYRARMGAKLTRAVQEELMASGFSVRVANPDDVRRNKDGVIRTRPFIDHEAVLDIQLGDVAMYSRRLDTSYRPSIDAYVVLVDPKERGEPLLDRSYVYGAYADKYGDGYLLSDARFAFPDFAALIAQPALVEASFDDGLQKLAAEIAKDVRSEFQPAQPNSAPRSASVPEKTEAATGSTSAGTSKPLEPPRQLAGESSRKSAPPARTTPLANRPAIADTAPAKAKKTASAAN